MMKDNATHGSNCSSWLLGRLKSKDQPVGGDAASQNAFKNECSVRAVFPDQCTPTQVMNEARIWLRI